MSPKRDYENEKNTFDFEVVKRPVMTTSEIDPALLLAIGGTARRSTAIEVKFQGDPIGARRLSQRLIGLAKRGYWVYPIQTARRGDSLFIWLKRPTRKKKGKDKPARALPPATTEPMPPSAASTAAHTPGVEPQG